MAVLRGSTVQARDRRASSWLNALDFQLNKEEFRDALRLRYNMKLDNLPTYCPCDKRFSVSHALDCKKGGFIHERHDNIKDTLTKLLFRVCLDVESEPHKMNASKTFRSYGVCKSWLLSKEKYSGHFSPPRGWKDFGF